MRCLFFSRLIDVRDAGRDTREGFVGFLRLAILTDGYNRPTVCLHRIECDRMVFSVSNLRRGSILGWHLAPVIVWQRKRIIKKNEESIGRRFGVSFEVG